MDKVDMRNILSYDPDTGIFRWKISPNIAIKTGDVAGGITRQGYLKIAYCHKNYLSHRLAWYMMTGEWPNIAIDHINGDPSDNRWCNLRLATPSQNGANMKPFGKLPKGVTFHKKTGKYQAQIKCNGRGHYLGLFDTPEEANSVYAAAAKRLFGEYARAA